MTNVTGAEVERHWDFVTSAEVGARHDYVNELAQTVNFGSVEQITAAGIAARADLSEDRLTATFRAVVPRASDVDLTRWSLRLADFLFNARATLDNVMWLVTHDSPHEALTEQEERNAYFPIYEDVQQWKSFAGTTTAKKLRDPLLERLHAAQPYRNPEKATSRGLVLLNKIHRDDKHREPLRLSLRLDTKLPVMLMVDPATPGPFEWWQDWLDWEAPIVDGLPIKSMRLDVPIKPPDGDFRLLVAPHVEFAGERYDLQDFIWDIQGGVQRAIDEVSIGDTARSEIWDAAIAWRRESEAACTRSILDGTNEWEERGFNQPNPFEALIAEFNSPNPDLSKFNFLGGDGTPPKVN